MRAWHWAPVVSQMETIMVTDVDPRLLKAVRERDQERQERIRVTRVAQALKLHIDKLRRQVREITTDAAVRSNSRSSEPDS